MATLTRSLRSSALVCRRCGGHIIEDWDPTDPHPEYKCMMCGRPVRTLPPLVSHHAFPFAPRLNHTRRQHKPCAR